MRVSSLLEQAGLDRNESQVYLSLIELKEATAGQIAKKGAVPRTYTYKMLESLMEKGFVQEKPSSGIKRYAITDFDAPKRYIEQQQLELYKVHQQAQSLSAQLENLADPQTPMPIAVSLKDQRGSDDFWQLLHSTITREIWIINPPQWWGDTAASSEVKRWEQFRMKQHVWEKRFLCQEFDLSDSQYVESSPLKSGYTDEACLVMVDHYQLQITSWAPFRALRIESQEMVELQKSLLQ